LPLEAKRREEKAVMLTTIVFRGLMVFHRLGDFMEIGFLDAPGHVPRILTMKGGILASVFDLRTRPELRKVRNWGLEVTNPLQPTATTFTEGESFDRLTHRNPRDFRWIADLEARDLFGRNLSAELNTSQLLLVLYVRHGEFYTKMKSPLLTRKTIKTDAEVAYGSMAAVTGCDIKFDTGTLKLVAGGTGGTVAFRFTEGVDQDTIYEFSNSPPDVPLDKPTPPDEGGHFPMYYDHLFITQPDDAFKLVKSEDTDPAPDPALCGATLLGSRTDPL
jgi:hypothetical protein